ncbi:MAG: adenosylmethionine--8-amino-7-oxononanoate transaminase [Methyloversatilis sp.]|uniref:adenosylmethionine--8-amino-7-oxononanoate transaminase n=1 Tax=Methyloversatilis sp. TaxID=2569862 RepID=UPI0027324124|nr:adenosylmethionine--8-amino-7-oxononanoate transaminase [Methyloversatilis sp.]MDP2870173.1 adenosylmethionine--8-amino-7-oxononanoate transaminase [Methyloversatilis sp.]MDP3456048.1 adenosylmethionine--8-amino-7-oxononanoate transaminase [Methyloversatilis sp.]MDP3580241.1 adenosylmethionine--8-amino-7-oxononanoate transaminase [Methyloversatilis sp.]
MSASESSLVSRSLAAVWHPCTQMQWHADRSLPLLAISSARGPWLHAPDGRRYLDGISSWWTNLFGHSHPAIVQALRDQLDTLDHVMLAGFTHEPVVALSEHLSALTGGRLGHAFYASDGASATEIALKMSLHYWRNVGQADKNEFICFAGSYHGETVGALAVTDVALFRDAYAPMVRGAHVLPSPAADEAAALSALDVFLALNHGRIAAMIVEPRVQCAGGMAMHGAAWLRDARRLCDRYAVHLIADEIAVGCGRTGTFFACEQSLDEAGGGWPDFICLSKGITGGTLPLSLVLSAPAVFDAFLDDTMARGFLHSHSYTGNPLACRAALATLDLFERLDILQRNLVWAQDFTDALAPLAAHPAARNFRQAGMIWALDIDAPQPEFSRRYYREALERGLLLRPLGNTLYFMPPYILDTAQTAQLADGARAALDAALA